MFLFFVFNLKNITVKIETFTNYLYYRFLHGIRFKNIFTLFELIIGKKMFLLFCIDVKIIR